MPAKRKTKPTMSARQRQAAKNARRDAAIVRDGLLRAEEGIQNALLAGTPGTAFWRLCVSFGFYYTSLDSVWQRKLQRPHAVHPSQL